MQVSAVLENPGKNYSVRKEFYCNNVPLIVLFYWCHFEYICKYIYTHTYAHIYMHTRN